MSLRNGHELGDFRQLASFVPLTIVKAFGEFRQLASFVPLEIVQAFGEFRQLASFVPLKIVQAFGEFGQLASFVSVYVSNGLGEFEQLADFWHSSVPCTWRCPALGGVLAHLRVMNLAIFDSWRVFGSLKGHWHLARFPLGECSTWHDISTWQGDIYLVHLAEVGGVRQMLLCAKCNVAHFYLLH